MTRRRKIMIGTALVCLLALILVPFWQSTAANRQLEIYAAAKYEAGRLERKAAFNPVNSSYDTSVSINGTSYRLSYDPFSRTIYDLYYIEQLDAQIHQTFEKRKDSLPDHLTFPGGISLFTGQNPGHYSQIKQRLYLTGIYNSQDLTAEESEKMPSAITMQVIDLMGKESYNITAVQIIYYDQNGGYTIEIGLTDSYAPVTYEKLLSHTKKLPPDRLGEDYKKWLAKR